MTNNATHPDRTNHGLTLVELLVALALATLVSISLIAIFTSYLRTQTAQEHLINMQQNLRAALYLMGRDLRMAGYKGPNPAGAPAAGFLTAQADALSFTFLDDASGTLTAISYTYLDSDGDGTKDLIRRNDGTSNEIIAEDIDGVEFYYTLDAGGQTTTPASPNSIRSVDITILARTETDEANFTNTATYKTPSGTTWGPYNDGKRRRMGDNFILFRNR